MRLGFNSSLEILGSSAQEEYRGKMELNDISSQILGAAFKVHTAIGPGVLESVYQTCLHHELHKAGLKVGSQVSVPVLYDGVQMESGYRTILWWRTRLSLS